MSIIIYHGDALSVLSQLPSNSVHAAITSPPYFQQCDYRVAGQYGLELTIEHYLAHLVWTFRELRRVLVDGAVFWVIVGDTQNNYSPVRGKGERRSRILKNRRKLQTGYREKEALQVPGLLVDAMRADGWLFRRELIWDKGSSGTIGNSDTAPLTHESVLQFGKYEKGGRPYFNCKPLKGSVLRYAPVSDLIHPCPFPMGLVDELLDASMLPGQTMIDPFAGSGTSLMSGMRRGRAIGIELNEEYCHRIKERTHSLQLNLLEVS
jgi:site-specific DNA-methyltransferase (cytosine-N4-specific)